MDAIRNEWSDVLLKAPLLALQQAGLHQAQARYQRVHAGTAGGPCHAGSVSRGRPPTFC